MDVITDNDWELRLS